MVGRAVDIVHESYFAIVLDRVTMAPMIICSSRGGIDIEEVARMHPEKILYISLDGMDVCLTIAHLEEICRFINVPNDPKIHSQMNSLYKLFIESDCLQVEINPLAVVSNGDSNFLHS